MVSHDENFIDSIAVDCSNDILKLCNNQDVVAIDEAFMIDDSAKSVECIIKVLKKAIAEGLEERAKDQEAKASEKKERAKKISEEK